MCDTVLNIIIAIATAGATFLSALSIHRLNKDKKHRAILCHKDLLVKVRTSRKIFETEMDLACDNFYDYTYLDDGISDSDVY